MSVIPALIPINAIVVDETLQPRYDGLDEMQVEALMQSQASWPPIVIATINDRTTLLDGFHRVEAASRLGLTHIEASLMETASDADLFQIAFELNAKHGKPLDLRDRKSFAKRLASTHPELSNREIGRRTGINHETVATLRLNTAMVDSQRSERRPGDLPADVSLFDPIRFSKATRAQKAAAGYIKRLAAALADPYSEDAASWWCDDAAELARAVSSAMKADPASELFTQLESDAQFILEICSARHSL